MIYTFLGNRESGTFHDLHGYHEPAGLVDISNFISWTTWASAVQHRWILHQTFGENHEDWDRSIFLTKDARFGKIGKIRGNQRIIVYILYIYIYTNMYIYIIYIHVNGILDASSYVQFTEYQKVSVWEVSKHGRKWLMKKCSTWELNKSLFSLTKIIFSTVGSGVLPKCADPAFAGSTWLGSLNKRWVVWENIVHKGLPAMGYRQYKSIPELRLGHVSKIFYVQTCDEL